ncbi:MAG: esterase [Prevotellaceae bacterium]|jgi:enterochelin esterase family protein|nr:esterase [Prevotellaceae bacterium]
MKRLASLLLLGLFCLSTNAQQALWSGASVVSPEIHEDNSVTFRLRAPKAVKVQVTGDFLPTQSISVGNGMTYDAPGVADLVEKEGVWEYTSAPLASELYSYSFVVDGLTMRDPSNIYQIRDVSSITNVFIIKGNPGDLYNVQDVPHGTVARRWYSSPTIGYDRRITIYTPHGYETSKKSYPVLYLLHGAGGDEEAWISLGRTAQILDNLIAEGKAEPMLVVMPNGNANQKSAPGEDERGLLPAGNPFAGGNRAPQQPQFQPKSSYELAFPDIVKFIESNYRVIKKKSARAIAGLSMGGGHSLNISKEFPDLFDYIGLYSAATITYNMGDRDNNPIYQNVEEKLKVQFAKHPKLYWIAIGKTDFLYTANVEYRKLLDDKGYKYEYFENEGGHIWKNWRIYLSMFAPMLFQK